MSARVFAQHYRQTAVSSAVLDASPHRLVTLMLAGVRERLRLAAACMDKGDIPRKGQAISEATMIIGELDGSLDHKAGGDIAAGLAALYEYSQRRLFEVPRARLELYDLERDPWEVHNLAGDPAQTARVKQMAAVLQEWMERTDDFPAAWRVRDDNTDRITGVAWTTKIPPLRNAHVPPPKERWGRQGPT